MMPLINFFKKPNASKKVKAGGPAPEDQLLAMAHDQYWVVLISNMQLLSKCTKGSILCDRVNAFKHALQTYGPTGNGLPDLRQNEGKAKNHVYHGHVKDSNGTTYVLEWAVIDNKKRIMVLINFGSHENYKYQQLPLSKTECGKILLSDINKKIYNNALEKMIEAKAKVERVEINYRKQI